MTSWKSLLLLSFIDLFLKGGIDVKATEANFFQSFLFFLILMSFLNLLFNYTRKERLQTNKDKIHLIYLLIFVTKVY